jgi:hypothetical protein
MRNDRTDLLSLEVYIVYAELVVEPLDLIINELGRDPAGLEKLLLDFF